MLTAGPVHYEVGANVDATGFGGIGAVHRLVTRLGLVEAIDADLELLKVHLPYHESDHVLNLAYNVACGGTRLEDIERLRHDTAYMNALGADLIPDPTTAGDFCRRFSQADVLTLMEAVNSVRPKLWTGRGADLLGPVAYLDVDGTLAPTGGAKKAGMDISYKGIWGYHPLIVSLANTREVLYLVNRPGNVPSHTGAAAWIDKAIDLVAPHTPRVCLRGDTDFSPTAHFDTWATRVDFVFGMDNTSPLRTRADALPESAWRRLHRPEPSVNLTGQVRARRADVKAAIVTEREYLNLELDYEDVAEFTYTPGKCARGYRVIALRKNITRARGEHALLEEIRYFFYITTLTIQTAEHIVDLANERCDQENLIGQLKSGINALRVPLYDLVSNWAYMVCAALAWNIKSWFALMMHRKSDRHTYIRMEFRRFLNTIILIPAMTIRRARTITIRLIGYTPAIDRLLSAWATIERTRFG
jgi:Transposase DDE domain group 1